MICTLCMIESYATDFPCHNYYETIVENMFDNLVVFSASQQQHGNLNGWDFHKILNQKRIDTLFSQAVSHVLTIGMELQRGFSMTIPV